LTTRMIFTVRPIRNKSTAFAKCRVFSIRPGVTCTSR
jgi:hypothetical protein